MSALRPLPPRPSLEFEHKEAKALLRRLRAGDSDALARARERHPALATASRIRLADAQLVIAREYGFASWPKLVRYFRDIERPRFHGTITGRKHLEDYARWLLTEHRERRPASWRSLAAWVPRFYGMREDEVWASTVTEDDTRLVMARMYGCRSWTELMECAETEERTRRAWEPDPLKQAWEALQAADLAGLKRVVEAHPELLQPTEYDVARQRTLAAAVLGHDRRLGRAAMLPIIEWLATQGVDFQRELNLRLCRPGPPTIDVVRDLLDRGADPNWVAPSGMTVLEHALISYWNGEAVDLVAQRAVPRKALWIAAGLGDVDGVRRSLDRNGNPTPAATKLRPDFGAAGPLVLVQHPEPDDEELLAEAFLVGMLNGRTAVLEYMVSRGFPIDTLVAGMPMLNFAVGNLLVPVVECLLRCGANPNIRPWRSEKTARELAAEWFEQDPLDPKRHRVIELLGLDRKAILAERDARPVQPPGFPMALEQALELAGDDAFRLGQSDIRPDNLLLGLVRLEGPPRSIVTKLIGLDVDRFSAEQRHRLSPQEEPVDRPKLPMHPDAQAAIQAAIAIATELKREVVYGTDLLHALTRAEHGTVADLLSNYGSSATKLSAASDPTRSEEHFRLH
jgi:hypothetical protein